MCKNKYIIIGLMLVFAATFAEATQGTIDKEAMRPKSGNNQDATVIVTNKFYDLTVGDGTNLGTFTVCTGDSHPATIAKAAKQDVLYHGARHDPWTTYLSIKSYSSNRIYSAGYSSATADSGCSMVYIYPYGVVTQPGTNQVLTTWTLNNQPDSLKISQYTYIEGQTLTESKIGVLTKIKNNGSTARTLGIRYEWDIMIDGNDGATMREKNPEGKWHVSESLWTNYAFTHYEITDDTINPTFYNLGSVTGPVYYTPPPAQPDLLQFASWPDAYRRGFKYTTTGKYLYKNDSAILYYWGSSPSNAIVLAPGDSVAVVQYLFASLITPTHQPDNQVKNSSDTAYIGNNIYNLTGDQQTKRQEVLPNNAAVYQAKIQNDGTGQDGFNVTGPASGNGWTVAYFDNIVGGNDITSQVTTTGWSTGGLNPQASREIRAEVTPTLTVSAGDSLTALILSTSQADNQKKDVVKVVTKVLPFHDVGVTEIIQPSGNVDSTATMIPKAKVKNFGNMPETFDASLTISSAKWASTKTVSNLLPNEERTIDFDLWTVGPRGNYTTNCATALTGDMVPSNNSLNGSFAVIAYDLNVSVVGNGTVTKNPNQASYTPGTQVTLTANPSTGWHFLNWSGDVISNTSPVIVTMNANKNITANFGIDSLEIISSATSGGAIAPLGSTIVTYGGSQSYTITPGTGYHIIDVLVDGGSVGPLGSYDFTNVIIGHSIHAVFGIDSFTITATAVGGGTITPPGSVVVTFGSDQSFAINPNTGYHIDSVIADGVNIGTPTSYTFYSVTTNHTIVGYFSINTYTITASAVGTGTVNPMGITTVSYGGSQAYTIIPGTGHHIDSVKVHGVNQGAITNYDFTNVTANHTIIGYFSINTYTITATAYGNGTITPAGVTVMNYGGSQAYLITPNTGNAIDSVLVDGVNQGIITNYNFTDVTANHTISAFFSGLFYTITATAYGNGTIIPKGVTAVNYGGSQSYTISPNTGYHIDSVKVDGVNQGAITNYNFTSVTANHTIDAYFSINTYKITATAGANGSITPSGAVIVTYGSDQNFIISPDIGYHILDVMVDGGSVGAVTNYNFINVTANHSIIATFGIDSFTITSSAGPNGTISPVGITYVTYNGNQSYTITPNIGYQVSDVLVDGNTVGAITNYTFNNITANHTITASFAINTYDLNVAIVGNGEVTKEPNLPEYEYGTQVTLTAIPVTGWIFTGWSGDIVSNDNPLIVTMDSDKNITATFTINTYDLNITIIGNGEVTRDPNLPEYEYGTQVTLTALPAEGWTFTGWSGDVVSADNPILVTMDNDKNITATFTVITYDLNVTVIGNGEVTRDPNLPEYEYGTQVTLTAIPVTGWTFTGWSGDVVSTDNPILVTMDNDKNITATFTVNTYTLTVATIGNGIVTIEPDLPAYEHGTYVTLTAVPDSGWALGRWSGSATGGANPLIILMDGNKSITATFVLRLWAQREPIPSHDPKPNKFVKDGGSIVAVNNQKNNVALYAFRGNRSREFYKYDSTWLQVESIPYGLKPPDPTKINKKKIGKGASLSYDGNNIIYATKGNGTKEFWAYDIAVDTWIPKAFVPVPKALKSGTSIAYYEGKVYLLAGSQRKIDSTNFYIYDPATDNWTPLSAAPAFDNKPYKDGSCIVPMDGMIYALKGGAKYNYFMRYTIASPGWVMLDMLPLCYPTNLISNPKKSKVKIGAAMTLAHDEIYIIKGGNNNEFWRYTTGTPGVWTAMDTIPKGLRGRKGCPANGASMAFCDDTIYLLKGNNSSEFWRYGPILGKSGTQPTTAKMPEAITNNSLMNTNLSTLPIANLNISLDWTTQSAAIHYTVELSGKVTIKVYDMNGRLVENINDRYLSSGTYTTTLSLMEFAKGIYFLKYRDITNKTEVKFVVR